MIKYRYPVIAIGLLGIIFPYSIYGQVSSTNVPPEDVANVTESNTRLQAPSPTPEPQATTNTKKTPPARPAITPRPMPTPVIPTGFMDISFGETVENACQFLDSHGYRYKKFNRFDRIPWDWSDSYGDKDVTCIVVYSFPISNFTAKNGLFWFNNNCGLTQAR